MLDFNLKSKYLLGIHIKMRKKRIMRIKRHKMTSIEYRDNIIRSYILGRTWDTNKEFQLIQKIVRGKREDVNQYLQEYPYIWDYEWEVTPNYSNLGKGDLIFFNGKSSFLIIECKYIDHEQFGSTAKTRRTKKRSQIKDQAKKYMDYFKELYPHVM